MPDSLDIVELVMAIEEALAHRGVALSPGERDQLAREIEARIQRGEFGDWTDFDDDDFAALVRKVAPRGPRGQAGAAAHPEDPSLE